MTTKNENKNKEETKSENEVSCCGTKCCDKSQIAKFLRHIADFFDKKEK